MHTPLLQLSARAAIGLGLAVVLVAIQPSAAPGPTAVGAPFLWLAAGGVVSGFLAGLLGIGGALITVPVFYLALPGLGVPSEALPQAVVASSLLSMLPTTLAGIRSHSRHGNLDLGLVRELAPRMALGATLGALLALTLRGPVLALVFAAQALYYGSRLVSGQARGAPGPAARVGAALPRWLVVPSISGFCACVGMGGGSMVMPYLMARGLSLHHAVATASALNLCIAFGGSVVFVAVAVAAPAPAGFVCWPAALAVGALAVVTVPWGVSLAQRLPGTRLGLLVGMINIAGALSLVAQVAAGPAAPSARTGAQQAAPVSAKAMPAATAQASRTRAGEVVEAEWHRWALHALLVPLLDDDLPVNWAEPTTLTPCTEGSSVTVDGQSIRHGTPLAAGPFVMRWRLVDCWPLGDDRWGLDGEVEITVVVTVDRILAEVRPRGLTAKTWRGRHPLSQPFEAHLWLVAPPRPTP